MRPKRASYDGVRVKKNNIVPFSPCFLAHAACSAMSLITFIKQAASTARKFQALPDGCGARTNRSGYSCRASRTDVSVYLDLSDPGFVPVDENWLCCLLGIEPVIIF